MAAISRFLLGHVNRVIALPQRQERLHLAHLYGRLLVALPSL